MHNPNDIRSRTALSILVRQKNSLPETQKRYFIVSLFVALLVQIYSCVIEIYNLKHMK